MAPTDRRASRRLGAAIKRLAVRRHFAQQGRRRETRAMPGGQCVAQFDEGLYAHAVDIGQGPAGERREAKAEDRADIGLARVGDDMLRDGARGLHRLYDEEALFQLGHVKSVRIDLVVGEFGETRP